MKRRDFFLVAAAGMGASLLPQRIAYSEVSGLPFLNDVRGADTVLPRYAIRGTPFVVGVMPLAVWGAITADQRVALKGRLLKKFGGRRRDAKSARELAVWLRGEAESLGVAT